MTTGNGPAMNRTTKTIPRSIIAATAVAALSFGAVACSDDDDDPDDVDNPVDTLGDQVDSMVDEVDSVVDTLDDQVDSVVDEVDDTTDG